MALLDSILAENAAVLKENWLSKAYRAVLNRIHLRRRGLGRRRWLVLGHPPDLLSDSEQRKTPLKVKAISSARGELLCGAWRRSSGVPDDSGDWKDDPPRGAPGSSDQRNAQQLHLGQVQRGGAREGGVRHLRGAVGAVVALGLHLGRGRAGLAERAHETGGDPAFGGCARPQLEGAARRPVAFRNRPARPSCLRRSRHKTVATCPAGCSVRRGGLWVVTRVVISCMGGAPLGEGGPIAGAGAVE